MTDSFMKLRTLRHYTVMSGAVLFLFTLVTGWVVLHHPLRTILWPGGIAQAIESSNANRSLVIREKPAGSD